jgi:hypothetical protein
MAEWEEEFEEACEIIVKSDKPNQVQESEDIIKAKSDYIPPSQEKKEDPNDYEKKWSEKNKDLIERKKNNEIAMEGLDEKDKQKKLIDKRIIDDVSDFLNPGTSNKKESVKDDSNNPLVTEKDFIDLAVNSITRIKAANKPSKFSFSYLKNSIDLLAPTLDGDKLDQLIKDLTVTFNKKIKSNKPTKQSVPAKAKPSVNVGKGLERAEKIGAIDDFGGNDDMGNEEEYYDDDFI